jgi:prepilin peptidase CpaA
MTVLPPSYQILLATLVLLAAGFDIRFRRIPNWLVLTGILLGLVLNTFLFGSAGALAAFLGGGLAMLVYFPVFALRGIGAGDVKLMMAVGFIVGPANWLIIFCITIVLGAAFAILYLLRTGMLMHTLWNVMFILGRLIRIQAPYRDRPDLDISNPRAMTMPHGATIAIGSLAFMLAPVVLRTM